MRKLIWILCIATAFSGAVLADDDHHHEGMSLDQLGTVHFPVSCTPEAQKTFEKGVALEYVETQMFQVAYLDFAGGVADPGNRGARKIESVVVKIQDGFHNIRVHDVRRGFDWSGHRGDGCGGLFEQGIHCGVDGYRIQERFITLNIHKDVALLAGRDFCYALGPGAMVRTRHASGTAEAFHCLHDAFIVGCDNYAGGASGQLGPLVYALDHGLASERNEWLAW